MSSAWKRDSHGRVSEILYPSLRDGATSSIATRNSNHSAAPTTDTPTLRPDHLIQLPPFLPPSSLVLGPTPCNPPALISSYHDLFPYSLSLRSQFALLRISYPPTRPEISPGKQKYDNTASSSTTTAPTTTR
eukprot:GHVT01067919.1.p1 GENE.GHVT01067919.1~~GHVT01067919.1.p1  ORF type:complete len:132 (+),score=9.08 GHVT01067919.1:121-516(+)